MDNGKTYQQIVGVVARNSTLIVMVIESAVTERFKKTAQRQIAFAQPNIIWVEPISHSDAVASCAIDADEDQFTMLQGDIISTEAAFLMGERIVGSSMFGVLSARGCRKHTKQRSPAALRPPGRLQNGNLIIPSRLVVAGIVPLSGASHL